MSQQSGSEESSQQKDKQRKNKKLKLKSNPIICIRSLPSGDRVIINVSMTHYEVIQEVAEELGWKVQRNYGSGNWDVLWTDHSISAETLIRMGLCQKISHYPGIQVLARKNLLGLSLIDMAKKFPEDYSFFPKTWLLPSQFPELRHEFLQKNRTFIVKPEASCQGKGIFLTQQLRSLRNGRHYVVQQYLQNPYLIDGLKFDLRIYVLLFGVNPMRLYIYEDGLVRFATEPYCSPSDQNLDKQYMHLTNYAINKQNPKFVFNVSSSSMSVGHKRTLTSVLALMKQRGQDVVALQQKIDEVIVKTLIVGQPLVSHQYRFCQPEDQMRSMCFHILGIDIMLDGYCKPYVLQVNHTPSFVTDTPLDHHVKFNLIKDTLVMLNVNVETRQAAIQKMQAIKREKSLLGAKRQLYENQQKQEKVKQAQQMRDAFEKQFSGGYRRVYPIDDTDLMQKYDSFIETADKLYFSEFNVLRAQLEKEKSLAEGKKDNETLSPTKSTTDPKLAKAFSCKQTGESSPSPSKRKERMKKTVTKDDRIQSEKSQKKVIELRQMYPEDISPIQNSPNEQQYELEKELSSYKIGENIQRNRMLPKIMPKVSNKMALKCLPLRLKTGLSVKYDTKQFNQVCVCQKPAQIRFKESVNMRQRQSQQPSKTIKNRKKSYVNGSFVPPKVVQFDEIRRSS